MPQPSSGANPPDSESSEAEPTASPSEAPAPGEEPTAGEPAGESGGAASSAGEGTEGARAARSTRSAAGSSRSAARSTRSAGGSTRASARSTRSAAGSTRASARSTRGSAGSAGSGAGGARRGEAAGSAEQRFDALARRLRRLNERIIEAGRDAGETTLASYEKALKAIASSIERGPGSSDIDWIATIANVQAKFIRELTNAWAAAARGLLK